MSFTTDRGPFSPLMSVRRAQSIVSVMITSHLLSDAGLSMCCLLHVHYCMPRPFGVDDCLMGACCIRLYYRLCCSALQVCCSALQLDTGSFGAANFCVYWIHGVATNMTRVMCRVISILISPKEAHPLGVHRDRHSATKLEFIEQFLVLVWWTIFSATSSSGKSANGINDGKIEPKKRPHALNNPTSSADNQVCCFHFASQTHVPCKYIISLTHGLSWVPRSAFCLIIACKVLLYFLLFSQQIAIACARHYTISTHTCVHKMAQSAVSFLSLMTILAAFPFQLTAMRSNAQRAREYAYMLLAVADVEMMRGVLP